jgi:hypothetical protein
VKVLEEDEQAFLVTLEDTRNLGWLVGVGHKDLETG